MPITPDQARAELARRRAAAETPTAPAAQAPKVGAITPEMARAELARRKSNQDLERRATPEFGGGYLTPATDYGKRIVDTVSDYPKKLAENINTYRSDVAKGDYIRAAGYVPKQLATTAETILSPITQAPILKDYPKVTGAILGGLAGIPGGPVGIGLGAAAGAGFVAGNEALQEHVQTPEYGQFATRNPNISGALETGGNILRAAGSVAGLKAPLGGATRGIKGLPKAPAAIKTGARDYVVSNEKSGWARPTTIPKATYGKARDVLQNAKEKGHDIPATLVRNGVKLSENIEDGNYSTDYSAEKIRADAAKMSNELLRPSLKVADYSTPRTPVSEILAGTLEDIRGSKRTTAGDIKRQVKRATAEAVILDEKYPQGMSLEEMHDNRITYAANGKYSPVGDRNVNNNAGVNRAIGRAFGAKVIEKAPEDVPVSDFQRELAKQFEAADYLDTINTKKVPVSIASRVSKGVAKVVGAVTGSAMGGGIAGGFGGYHMGGIVEGLLESVPNPVKSYFLNNLEKTNPPAFEAVRAYLGKEMMDMLMRKKLPAPTDIYVSPSKGRMDIPVSQQAKDQFAQERKGVAMQNERDVYNFDQQKEAGAVEALRNMGARYGRIGELPKPEAVPEVEAPTAAVPKAKAPKPKATIPQKPKPTAPEKPKPATLPKTENISKEKYISDNLKGIGEQRKGNRKILDIMYDRKVRLGEIESVETPKVKAPAYKRAFPNGYITIGDAWGNEYVQIKGKVPETLKAKGIGPKDVHDVIKKSPRAQAESKMTLKELSRNPEKATTIKEVGIEESGNKREIVRLQTSDGNDIYVDNEYLNLARREYPNAEFFATDGQRPVALKENGEIVAIVMPIRVEKGGMKLTPKKSANLPKTK